VTYLRAADGARIHYRVTGRPGAPPILFIQGLGADKNGWNLQRLATAPWYRAIALDNRGAGRSDKPHGTYSLEQMADDAVAVLDHVGVDDAHVVGASMGGAISQLVAVKHPARVRSLTLACTAGRTHPWREELLREWRDTALQRGIGSMGQIAARWVIGPRSFRRLNPAIGWLGPLALGRPAHAFAAQCDAILNVDATMAERLGSIEVPTLVVVGNQDILTPVGDSEELAERIPTAELVVISGAAHGLMVEHASTFNRVLLEFLGRAERAHRARTRADATVDAGADAIVAGSRGPR
jgi:3-oxoadipate enol-lactonase